MSKAQTYWDTTYLNNTDWGNKYPTDYLDRILPQLKPDAKILDLGCGEGRNSLYLATLGFEVYSMDISKIAIERLNHSRKFNSGTIIHAWVGDILDFSIERQFDLVIAYGILNSIPVTQWRSVISNIKKHTTPNGYNIIAFFNEYSDTNSIDGKEVVCLGKSTSMYSHYHNWNMIHHDCRTFIHQHGLRSKHMHVTERVIVQNSMSSIPSKLGFKTVGVIGPSKPFNVSQAIHIPEGTLEIVASKVGIHLAATEKKLVCIPDNGIGKIAFQNYSQSRPLYPPLILVPNYDPLLSKNKNKDWHLTLEHQHELISDLNWDQQAPTFVKNCDAIIVIGLSCGTLIELLWTKWINRPVFMSLDLCSPLPSEIRNSLSIFELPTHEMMIHMFNKLSNKMPNHEPL